MSNPASSPSVVPFQFESHEIRTIVKGGEPWFVAKDVCDVLELKDHRTSVNLLDEDDRHTMPVTDALGRNQETFIINEPGLYSLILRSRKPEAKAFKRWITHEVLPTIRKTGGYALTNRGKRSDIIHYRGPASGAELGIRYTLDLTKILTRPTKTSLSLLQRLTGIEMEDLVEALIPERSNTTLPPRERLLLDYLAAMTMQCPGTRVRLSEMLGSYNRWRLEIEGVPPLTSHELGEGLRAVGCNVGKRGGVVWVHDLQISGEVA